jgi:hypothetical protein
MDYATYSLAGYYKRVPGVNPNLHVEDGDNSSSEKRVITYIVGDVNS